MSLATQSNRQYNLKMSCCCIVTLVRQLLHVADMIPLVLQKIAYHETHPDCSEVISKIPWPIVRVRDIPQQKSGYVLYI